METVTPDIKMYDGDFNKYLIMVGVRSHEFTYEVEDVLFNHIEYFRKCHEDCLSPYKALVFLHDHINEQDK